MNSFLEVHILTTLIIVNLYCGWACWLPITSPGFWLSRLAKTSTSIRNFPHAMVFSPNSHYCSFRWIRISCQNIYLNIWSISCPCWLMVLTNWMTKWKVEDGSFYFTYSCLRVRWIIDWVCYIGNGSRRLQTDLINSGRFALTSFRQL